MNTHTAEFKALVFLSDLQTPEQAGVSVTLVCVYVCVCLYVHVRLHVSPLRSLSTSWHLSLAVKDRILYFTLTCSIGFKEELPQCCGIWLCVFLSNKSLNTQLLNMNPIVSWPVKNQCYLQMVKKYPPSGDIKYLCLKLNAKKCASEEIAITGTVCVCVYWSVIFAESLFNWEACVRFSCSRLHLN